MRKCEGRGSALVFALVAAMVAVEVAEAAVYTVGDAGGWTYNVVGWPNGKRFRAGDTLVFNYNRGVHNVVPVNGYGYSRCSGGVRQYGSGNDQIKLVKGQNYFICSVPGHCQSGMKIAVNAV